MSTFVATSTNNHLWAVIAAPVGAVLGVITTRAIARVNEATDRRRERYAEAVQTLVAWTEFPYRVRRRTDNNPSTITALANHGHDLQERLAYHQAWIATEHPNLAHTYATTRGIISHDIGPIISEAWESEPIATASEMNLAGWGSGTASMEAITSLQKEIANRFAFRLIKRKSIASSRVGAGKHTQPTATHLDLSHREQNVSDSKVEQTDSISTGLNNWHPLSQLDWVLFLLLATFSYCAGRLYGGGFLEVWLLPVTGLGLILGALAFSPLWIGLSTAFVKYLRYHSAKVISISGIATGSVFVGIAIIAAVASPIFLETSASLGTIGEILAAPVTTFVATILLGVFTLVSTTVFGLCSHSGVRRITSSIAVVSAVCLPILLALSAHYMLRLMLLGFLG